MAATNGAGTSPYSSDNFVIAAESPNTPTNLVSRPIAKGVRLQWSAPVLHLNEFVAYDMEHKVSTSDTFELVGVNISYTSCILSYFNLLLIIVDNIRHLQQFNCW